MSDESLSMAPLSSMSMTVAASNGPMILVPSRPPLIMTVASCARILNVGCPGPPGTPGKAVVECPGPPGTPGKAVGVLNWGCFVPAPMKDEDEGVVVRDAFGATPWRTTGRRPSLWR